MEAKISHKEAGRLLSNKPRVLSPGEFLSFRASASGTSKCASRIIPAKIGQAGFGKIAVTRKTSKYSKQHAAK